MIRYIKTLFEEEYYFKPKRVIDYGNDTYIEYESNIDRTNLSLQKYLDRNKSYLKNIIVDLQESDTWNF